MSVSNIVKKIVQNRFNMKGAVNPSYFTYFITWRCNARCIMCDAWKHQAGQELTFPQIKQMFEKIPHIDAVRITGGEPFIRGDISSIIEYFVDRKVSVVHVTSNGLLTDRITETINEFKHCKSLHVKISIDSIGSEHDRIRGVEGAFSKAMAAVENLAQLRSKGDFFLAVNQTIVSPESLDTYYELKKILDKINVDLLPVIAHQKVVLYDFATQTRRYPEGDIETFCRFDSKSVERLLNILTDKLDCGDWREKLLKKYYLKGLRNRLLNKNKFPNPSCKVLQNHFKIFPDGSVPVCLYNSNKVGNLSKQSLEEITSSEKYISNKKWVSNCPGCWTGCESLPNAIYSGDLIKGLY